MLSFVVVTIIIESGGLRVGASAFSLPSITSQQQRRIRSDPPHPTSPSGESLMEDEDISQLSSSSSSSSFSTNSTAATTTSSTPNRTKKIEFVNFWGSRGTTGEETDEKQIDPRMVPCVPSLDPLDGPLPPGAYLKEGNLDFDPKSTCRISIAVQYDTGSSSDYSKSKTMGTTGRAGQSSTTSGIDPNEIVRLLQNCIDCGFNTFQMQDQGRQGLDIVRRMKQQTPSYIETHWAVNMMVPTTSMSPLVVRQQVVQLLQETRSDALDSLQLVYNPQSPYSVDTLDVLADLQREGLIRSIGTKHFPSTLLTQIKNDLGPGLIDYQQQTGNLLLPPTDLYVGGPHDGNGSDINLWLADPLAAGLLTDLYNTNQQWTRLSNLDQRKRGSMARQGRVLQEWASRRQNDGDDNDKSENGGSAWNKYEKHVLERFSWIALKHQVSMESVALRWVLECGGSCSSSSGSTQGANKPSSGAGPLVSSTVVDCVFDDRDDDVLFQRPVELRQVFRFQLDDEDKAMLRQCSADWRPPSKSNKVSKAAFDVVPRGDLSGSEREEVELLERKLQLYHKEGFADFESHDESDDDNYPEIDLSNQALWL